MTRFDEAAEIYAAWGIDARQAIDAALAVPISIHCWQADDVAGFEVSDGAKDGGGILATGNFPGRATCAAEVRQDLEKVLDLVPGTHRFNLHASYAETDGGRVERDALTFAHFRGWHEWAVVQNIHLDFNPTYFGHPKAASGFTLSSAAPGIQEFWIRHGIVSREIARDIAAAQGSPCVNNHWVPDGAKDSPADRWSPRRRLREAYDQIFASPMPGCVDAVESKLFGLGSEDYVVGSFEFYTSYALKNGLVYCLDMGHFHPTESVADKLSALMQFHDRILLHTSRPMRWDSDHVVLFNDELRAVFQELVRGNALGRAIVALDFFDASINRIAAYVVGIRATRKAMLYALLDPRDRLQKLESEGRLGQKLAMMEEVKTLPFGAVWDELCECGNVPVGPGWIDEIDAYAERVLSARA